MKHRFLTLLTAFALFFSASATNPSDSIADVAARRSLKHSISGAAMGLVINATVTEVLKHTVNEMRPDRSDNSSFPSRHSSYAFAIASIASHELYRYSPFWVTAAHTAANAVGMQRTFSEKHYPGDVLAGASIGLASSEIGYALSDLLFGRSGRGVLYSADNMPGLWAETTALISFDSHNASKALGCGIESALRLSLPTSDSFGLGVSAKLRSQPVFSFGEYVGPLNGLAVSADTYAHKMYGSWSVDGRVSFGLMRYIRRPEHVVAPWSYLADISLGMSRQIARRLAVGGRIGCDLANRPKSDAALSVTLFTKAQF